MAQHMLAGSGQDLQQDTTWSWIVAVAAFSAHLISHGIVYSFGILFLTIQDTFSGTKAQISWIPSLTTGCLYLIGPLASIMVNRYGCRTVTTMGAIFGCLGYLISMFVRELFFLYISMGIIAGCGFGMVFLPSILIVTRHFNKYRSLACGFALSGAGGGAFVFSPLLENLITVYAWKGTLLLLSAIILNCIPCGLVYQSLSTNKKTHETNTLIENNPNEHSQEEQNHLMPTGDNSRDRGQNIYSKERIHVGSYRAAVIKDKFKSDDDLSTKEIQPNKGIIIEIVHEDAALGKVTEALHRSTKYDDVIKNRKSALSRYITLFKCTEVTVFFVSQFLFFAGFYLPFIYIPDKARGHEILEEDAAWIASTIGISSIIGRIVLGYLADRPFVNRMILFKTALLLTGISTCFVPYLNTFGLLLMYAVIYGISTGITLSLTSVVLVDIAGIDLLSDAMGLNNLFSAFGSLLGPPVAGLLYDMTQSYTASFLASGITMTISGIMLIIVSFCRKSGVHLQ